MESPVLRVTGPTMRLPAARWEARCEAAPARARWPLQEPAACLGWSGLQAAAPWTMLRSGGGFQPAP